MLRTSLSLAIFCFSSLSLTLHGMDNQTSIVTKNFLDLPPEVHSKILDALFDAEHPHIDTISYQSLNSTCTTMHAALTDDIKRSIHSRADQYHISPLVAAAYLGTKAAQNWFEKEKECPLGFYSTANAHPVFFRSLFNYKFELNQLPVALYQAAQKQSVRLALSNDNDRTRKIANFFKKISSPSKPEDSPHVCAESEQQLFLILNNLSKFSLYEISSNGVEPTDIHSGLLPTILAPGSDNDLYIAGMYEGNQYDVLHINSNRDRSLSIMPPSTRLYMKITDMITNKDNLFLLLTRQHETKQVACITSIKKNGTVHAPNTAFGENSFSQRITAPISELCLALTSQSIIIANPATYEKIGEFDLQGNVITTSTHDQVATTETAPTIQ